MNTRGHAKYLTERTNILLGGPIFFPGIIALPGAKFGPRQPGKKHRNSPYVSSLVLRFRLSPCYVDHHSTIAEIRRQSPKTKQ